MKLVTVALVLIPLIACSGPPEVDQILVADALRGDWRSVLESPGGDLPFGLRIGFNGGRLTAVILNHDEEVPTSSVSVDSDRVVIEMNWYDSRLEGLLYVDVLSLEGSWTNVIHGGVARLMWVALSHLLDCAPDGGCHVPHCCAGATPRFARVAASDRVGKETPHCPSSPRSPRPFRSRVAG